MPKNAVFSDHQERFISTFVEECIRELQFIVDISRGRAQARPSFFDQLIGKVSLGSSVLSTVAGFLPGVGGALETVGQAAVSVITGLQYLFERKMNSNVEALVQGAKQPEILLRLMIEGVAREAARRHEFFLNHRCAPEAIDLFAIVGIARVLQYLSDHKDIQFTPENLLKGLMDGKSGAGKQGFKNNKLSSQHPTIAAVSAETVYRRSAVMSLDGRYHANDRVKLAKEFPRVAFPKAGVMLLRAPDILACQYAEKPVTAELQEYLHHYSPGCVELGRADIEAYMDALKRRDGALSLIEHCEDKGVSCRANLEGLDLSNGQFQGVDFAGAQLNGATLNGAVFERAYLVGADLSRVTAIGANFKHANLSLVNADNACFKESQFIGAKIFYSRFAHTDMTGIQFLGSDWYGSDLLTLKADESTGKALATLKDFTTELLHRQNLQEGFLAKLQTEVTQQQRDQVCQIDALQDQLSQVQSELRFELAKMQEQLGGLAEESSAEAAAERATLKATLESTISEYRQQYALVSAQLAEQQTVMQDVLGQLEIQKGQEQESWNKISDLANALDGLAKMQNELSDHVCAISKKLAEHTERIEDLEKGQAKLATEVDGVKEAQQELRTELMRYLMDHQRNYIEKSVAIKLAALKRRVLDDRDRQSALELYIPVRASLNTNPHQSFDLEKEALTFIQSDKKIMLVLGGAGEGKSTFNTYLHRQLWANFKEGDAIPVFISLPSMQSPATKLLSEYFHGEQFTAEEIAILHDNYSFVFILDGYDEMNDTPNLYTTNKLDTWQAKIIISCRTQYLTQFVRYERFFKPIHLERTLDHAFQEVAVVPFNESQVDAYIRKYLELTPDATWQHPEVYHEHINTLPGLRDLVQTPFLLMIALKVMPRILDKYKDLEAGARQRVTKSELYDAFMQEWFQRGELKVLSNPSISLVGWHDITAEFQRASEELAKEMHHADVMQVRYQTSDRRSASADDAYFQSFEVSSVTLAELAEMFLEENTVRLVYIQDAIKPEEQWRIIAKNNAGSPCYHPKTGWLPIAELARRWLVRDSSIPAHQEKVKALNYALTVLGAHTPSTLTTELQDGIFQAIILGLTHPWHQFFDLDNPQVQKTLPGIPVKHTNRGAYAFLHAELLTHLSIKAIKREERLHANPMKGRKPWDPHPPIGPALAQQGMFAVVQTVVVDQAKQPVVASSQPLQKNETESASFIILNEKTNYFYAIHAYLSQKKTETPFGFVARLEDFQKLLTALKHDVTPRALETYLVSARNFHHRNFFKGNRYQTLRAQLKTLDTDSLQQSFDDYIAYLRVERTEAKEATSRDLASQLLEAFDEGALLPASSAGHLSRSSAAS